MSPIIPNQPAGVTLALALLLLLLLAAAAAAAVAFAVHERRRVNALAETVAYQSNRLRAHGALFTAIAEDYELPAAGLDRPALYVIDGESLPGADVDHRADLLVVTG